MLSKNTYIPTEAELTVEEVGIDGDEGKFNFLANTWQKLGLESLLCL